MTIGELKAALTEAGFNIEGIYFGDGLPTRSDTWTIHEDRGLWEIFYFERGERSNAHWFGNEDTACRFFLTMFLENRALWEAPRKTTS